MDSIVVGVESEEVRTEHSESCTAKAGVEVGAWMGFDDGLFGKVEAGFCRLVFVLEEVAGVGNVAFGPTYFVHLRKVLDKVVVSIEASLDLTEVDDQSTGKVLPLGFDNGVGDVGGSNHQVIMGPTATGEFSNTKVFDLTEAVAKRPHNLGNLSASFVEGVAGVVVERRVDGESEKAIGFGPLGLDGELADLVLCTMTTRPLLTGKSDEDSAAELC